MAHRLKSKVSGPASHTARTIDRLFLFFIAAAILGGIVFYVEQGDFTDLGITGASIAVEGFTVQNSGNGTQCGGINQSITLTSNITATDTCFIINASNIILDGNDYTILSSTGLGTGVSDTSGYDNLTVKNLRIINFSVGVDLLTSENSTIFNNIIITSNASNSRGIAFHNNSNSNNASWNNISTEQNKAMGINISNSSNNKIHNNVINTSGDVADAIIILLSSESNFIYENEVNTSGTNSVGIHLGDSSANGGFSLSNSVYENHIRTRGTNGQGIAVDGSSFNNVSYNNVYTAAQALFLNSIADNNTFMNNNFTSTGASEILDSSDSCCRNYLVYNNTFGMITWVNITNNLTMRTLGEHGIKLGTTIFIENNTISVNTSLFFSYNNKIPINTTTNITLRGIDFITVNGIAKADYSGKDSASIIQDGINCEGTFCTIISYERSTGTLIFNASTMSSYSAIDYTCGIIMRNINVMQDINTTDTCYIINASNLILNGSGRIITNNGTGYGISIENFNNITIKNFRLTNFTRGIHGFMAGNLTIWNNTIKTTEVGLLRHGISLQNVSQGNISNNTITTNATNSHGINITIGSNDNKIYFNWINSSKADGITFGSTAITSNRNNVSGNYILASSNGIRITGDNNYANNNTILVKTSGTGIVTAGVTLIIYNNTILTNNINATGDGTGMSFTLTSGSLVESNIIEHSTGNGIALNNNAQNTTVLNNVINSSSSGTNIFIDLVTSTGARDSKLINNNLTSLLGFEIRDEGDDGSGLLNYLIYNNSFGEIKWINNGTGSFLENLTFNVTNDQGIGLGRNLFINNNTVALNSSALGLNSKINSKANITLQGLDLNVVKEIRRLESYAINTTDISDEGVNCIDISCTNTSYAGGILQFNTSSFSSFTASNNSRPNASSLILNSTGLANLSTSDLYCYANLTDQESATVSVNYTWYNNSVEETTLRGQLTSVQVNNLTLITTLIHHHTTKNQNWTCSVQAHDGVDAELDWNNITMTILNTPPNETSIIENRSLTNGDARDLTLSQYFNDSDGDDINYTVYQTSSAISFTIDNTTDTLTLRAISTGSVLWQLIATDGTSNTTSHNFSVTINTAEESAPSSGGGGGHGSRLPIRRPEPTTPVSAEEAVSELVAEPIAEETTEPEGESEFLVSIVSEQTVLEQPALESSAGEQLALFGLAMAQNVKQTVSSGVTNKIVLGVIFAIVMLILGSRLCIWGMRRRQLKEKSEEVKIK